MEFEEEARESDDQPNSSSYVAPDGTVWVRIKDTVSINKSDEENIVCVSSGPSASSKRKVNSVLSAFFKSTTNLHFEKFISTL